MTENEIKELKRRVKENKVLTFNERKYINNALEEIQPYRAMEERLKKVYGECDGLLEVIVSGLERHENLELPSITVKSRLLTDEDVDMWDEYRAIGTIEEFKALKEKNEPKKAVLQATTEKTHYKCPCCNNIMQTIYRDGVAWGHMANYCEWCGQALET